MLRKLCQICEAESAQDTCQKCGRLMGKNCKKNSICKACSERSSSSMMSKNL